jgi:hypothetical protein
MNQVRIPVTLFYPGHVKKKPLAQHKIRTETCIKKKIGKRKLLLVLVFDSSNVSAKQ